MENEKTKKIYLKDYFYYYERRKTKKQKKTLRRRSTFSYSS